MTAKESSQYLIFTQKTYAIQDQIFELTRYFRRHIVFHIGSARFEKFNATINSLDLIPNRNFRFNAFNKITLKVLENDGD